MSVLTGFKDLDQILGGGLKEGYLYLIAARPAMGKTSFALNIFDHISVRGNGEVALYISVETGRRQLIDRIISMESGVDTYKIRNARLSSDDWKCISIVAEKVAEAEFIIEDQPGVCIKEIEDTCRGYKRENKRLSVIIIDYLQLICGDGSNDTNREEVESMMMSLNALAKELKVSIVLLSQLSRSVENREDHRPLLSDLHRTGIEERYPDVVIFLYRDEYYDRETERKGIAEIIVAKNGDDIVGTITLVWIAQLGLFVEPIIDEDGELWNSGNEDIDYRVNVKEEPLVSVHSVEAFIKLKHLCATRIYDKYGNKNCVYAYREMEKELNYIRDSGAAMMLMTMYEALKGANAKQNQYRLRGALGSSLVLYLLDFSEIDPLNYIPRLYPAFRYGEDGKKLKSIEMNVKPKLYKRLVRYFERYSCGVGIRHRHFTNGKLFGVDIYDPHDEYRDNRNDYRFCFLETKKKL